MVLQFFRLGQVRIKLQHEVQPDQLLFLECTPLPSVLEAYTESLRGEVHPRFNPRGEKIAPLTGFSAHRLDGMHPSLCGCVFRLACEVAQVVHGELGRLADDQVYMGYNAVLERVFRRLEGILGAGDLLGVDDCVARLREE
eukprot:EST41870.1 Hypothetical protein SS50377_18706 [Spironucleus salmonicida]